MHRTGTETRHIRFESKQTLERFIDLVAWAALLALFGFVCDPDAVWLPVRLGNWTASLIAG